MGWRALVLLPVLACSGSEPAADASTATGACAPFDPGHQPGIDPRIVCAVDCTSASTASDVTVHIDPTAQYAATFVAHVVQSRPQAVDMTFTATTASWSGDFYNFDDHTSRAPLQLHVLVGTANSPANVEIYTDPDTLTGGPVNVGGIDCRTRGYTSALPPG